MGSQNPPRSNLALFFQFSDLVKVQIWLQLCQRMKKIYVQAKGIKAISNNFCNNSRNKLHLQYVAFSILHLRAYWELLRTLRTKQLLTSTHINRVSQQVWDMLNVTFWSSEKLASEASSVYKYCPIKKRWISNFDPINRGEFQIFTW